MVHSVNRPLNTPIDNHIDIFFMHFPSMSRNGQVATASCNGQVFF
jgi:hypothetical protein